MKIYWCVAFCLTLIVSELKAKSLVDPTRPKYSQEQQKENSSNIPEKFVLTAVFINNKNKYAVINGQNYQTGQKVQGSELISISQNQVVLDTTDGKKTLHINNHSIKKDINNVF
ncbi:hypothetical protein L0668_04585 [Paraglaciecola aquimarina]|uniref:MSHA biogenesis protein MshK n=1 Tax=Paraglaciecola algarum TaxID=3050085 RepID=A0ABS9D370_9ALTE|nr:hypothetical protein [Paraglaciecola sp. G1-23]MCF2947373.1 hypothetical protein [Paraglaciecola sp. G1-23]